MYLLISVKGIAKENVLKHISYDPIDCELT